MIVSWQQTSLQKKNLHFLIEEKKIKAKELGNYFELHYSRNQANL